MRSTILGLILMISAVTSHATDYVYIITGQSNSAGAGNPAYLTAGDKRVPGYFHYCANYAGKELNTIADPYTQYGIEVRVKDLISNNLPRGFSASTDRIVIVKTALAVPIDRWKRHGTEYSKLIEALFKCGIRQDAQYMAVFLLHGEANRVSIPLANSWGPDVAVAITDIRTAVKTPDMPVIYTQVGLDITPANYLLELRASQAALPSLVSNVHMVDMSYVEKHVEPDGILLHYKYQSQVADLLWNKYRTTVTARSRPAGASPDRGVSYRRP